MLVNGLETQVRFGEASMLLLESWLEGLGPGRQVVLLAGPPGSGKSTLAAQLQHLAEGKGISLQALGMDGFHLPRKDLTQEQLQRRGAPDTFDLPGLDRALQRAAGGDTFWWPAYDRRIHDPVAEGTLVTGEVLLVEGNWLLLDEPGWRDLSRWAARTVFLAGREADLRQGLIARKVLGGSSPREARAHFDRCDGPNIRLCLAKHLPPQVTWLSDGKGGITAAN